MALHTIVVFPDGETWNTINGCYMCVVTDEQFTNLCSGVAYPRDIEPLIHIQLHEGT
jgi:hypothetical protein